MNSECKRERASDRERFENVHATRKFVYKTSTNTKSNKINQKLKRNLNRKFTQINTNNHMHTETVKLTVVELNS